MQKTVLPASTLSLVAVVGCRTALVLEAGVGMGVLEVVLALEEVLALEGLVEQGLVLTDRDTQACRTSGKGYCQGRTRA